MRANPRALLAAVAAVVLTAGCSPSRRDEQETDEGIGAACLDQAADHRTDVNSVRSHLDRLRQWSSSPTIPYDAAPYRYPHSADPQMRDAIRATGVETVDLSEFELGIGPNELREPDETRPDFEGVALLGRGQVVTTGIDPDGKGLVAVVQVTALDINDQWGAKPGDNVLVCLPGKLDINRLGGAELVTSKFFPDVPRTGDTLNFGLTRSGRAIPGLTHVWTSSGNLTPQYVRMAPLLPEPYEEYAETLYGLDDDNVIEEFFDGFHDPHKRSHHASALAARRAQALQRTRTNRDAVRARERADRAKPSAGKATPSTGTGSAPPRARSEGLVSRRTQPAAPPKTGRDKGTTRKSMDLPPSGHHDAPAPPHDVVVTVAVRVNDVDHAVTGPVRHVGRVLRDFPAVVTSAAAPRTASAVDFAPAPALLTFGAA